jgi:hypothetical protein
MAWWNTGEGTPWGPTETGKPETPKMINPWDVQGMDQTGQRAAMLRQIAQGAGNASANAVGQLQKAGIGGPGSADAARMGERIAEGQTQNIADATAQLQNQDYNQRMGLAQMMNNEAMQRYGIDAGNFNAEQQGRGGFWNGLAGAAGNIVGGLLGRK